ncbi:hypothetical protein ACWIGF_23315 [Streptomyces diastaticus]|nr:hypothetical protein OH717_05870 [Streptomyces albidoflavus]
MKPVPSTAARRIASTRTAEDDRCWVCGTLDRRARADVHLGGVLCLRCWAYQPRGRTAWSRAASALCLALQLDKRLWHENGMRSAWVEQVARKRGVQAWHDAAQGNPVPDPPAEPFGWINPDDLDAAASVLAALEAEFQRARVRPART